MDRLRRSEHPGRDDAPAARRSMPPSRFPDLAVIDARPARWHNTRMREIKVVGPKGSAAEVARLALDVGIAEASSREVRVSDASGVREEEETVVKSSTPKIRALLSALYSQPGYDRRKQRVSAHMVLALVAQEPIADVTKPVVIPFTDVQQDLWKYCHVTPSFAVRSAASAGLLAFALLRDETVLAIGAMIFTPFSPLILSTGFGLASRHRRHVRQGLLAFAAAFVLTVAAAAATAAIDGGPMTYADFGRLESNLLMSAVLGVLAAAADSDEVGRQQLMGLAMAYPLVKFPVWIGISLVLGFPDAATTRARLASLVGDALIMTAMAALTYRAMARRGELERLPD